MMLRKLQPNQQLIAAAVTLAALSAHGLTPAQADVWHFTAHLNGDQVTPPTSSDATGIAHLTYDDETNLLQVDIFVEGIGLDNDWTAAHIHLGRKGFAGPWNIQLGPLNAWNQDGDGIRRTLVDEPYPEEDEHFLLTDGTFIMLHTVEWPGGEIRGQIIQEPRLTPSALARNRPAFLHLINAQPGEKAFFAYGTNGLGTGRTIPELGGVTLDILEHAYFLGAARADDTGTAMFRFMVPEDAPLIEIFWQTVVARGVGGADSVKSNTTSSMILP